MILAEQMRMAWLILVVVTGLLACGRAGALDIAIEVDRDEVDMGRTVAVDVRVTTDDGSPAEDCLVLSYVNERRWGAHERTDGNGRVRLLLPLPNPGPAVIQVQALPSMRDTHWIWSPQTRDEQAVYLEKSFTLGRQANKAVLRVAVDNSCDIFVNGRRIGRAAGWTEEHVFEGLEDVLRSGKNTIAFKARNADGPAGVAARLTIETGAGNKTVATDGSWRCCEGSSGAGQELVPVAVVGPLDGGPWPDISHWPGIVPRDQLFAGRPIPGDAELSNSVTVHVKRRSIRRHEDPDHVMIMQWEPWFTPRNPWWQTAPAVPIVGFYDSYNPDVIRQHALWFMDAGVDAILPDWSNHIWGKQHWNERASNTHEILHATTLMLEGYAAMRDEGLPVPKVVLMPGLSNGPPAAMQAVNEELDWVYENYLRNPRFDGLWLEYEGKPLIVILDCGYLVGQNKVPPVDDTHFTVRWMGTQLQITHGERFGYWSWMDGSLEPIVTYYNDAAEAVTPTPAYFGPGGWTHPEARGRRGGTTFIESFKAALNAKPRFVMLHQWNEFTGQAEGHGHGKNHDVYADTYSVELSDDLEPVSLTAHGYRGGKGGWGYYYLNLTQALISLVRQDKPEDTILAVHVPADDGVVRAGRIEIDWAVIGKPPSSYTVLLDGRTVVDGLQATSCALDLAELPEGRHTVTVVAEGGTTRFPLSRVEMDTPLETPVPTKVEVPFVLERTP